MHQQLLAPVDDTFCNRRMFVSWLV